MRRRPHKIVSFLLLIVLLAGMGMACRMQSLEKRDRKIYGNTENKIKNTNVKNVKTEQKNRTEKQERFGDEPKNLYARSAVLMDADSGRVLYGKAEETVRPMASTTKIMTCIVALEYLKDHPKQLAEISERAVSQPKVHLGMQKGEKFYVYDLLYSLMLESHNDSAVAVAEGVAGTVEAFAGKMNKKAEEIGCKDTYFITPNGLDEKDDTGIHSTTAEDLAKIMRYCIMLSEEKEEFLKITGTKEYQFCDVDKKRTFSCHNHNAFLDMMDGALSGKTGFTADAGYCYVGSLRRDERTFIVALLACGWPNNKGYKWKDTRALMEYGLEHYHYQPLSAKVKLKKLLVADAFDPERPYHTSEYITLHVTGSKKKNKVLLRDGESIRVEKSIRTYKRAPVKKNEKAGKVLFYLGEEKIAEDMVVTGRGVEERTWEKCLEIVAGKFLTMESLMCYVKSI